LIMKYKRAAFWTLLFVSGLLVVWWILFLPYVPSRLYAAIPPDAAVVTEHVGLGRYWQDLLRHPLVRAVALSHGVEASDLDAALGDPDVGQAVERYAGRHVVFGYVPAFGFSGRPAWVGASWLGREAQWLRLALFLGAVEGFEQKKLSDGRSIWVNRNAGLPDGAFLSVAVSEGVLLICASHEPNGVGYILGRSEEEVRPVDVLADRMAEGRSRGVTETGPALVWVRWYDREPDRFRYRSIRCRVLACDTDHLALSADMPLELVPIPLSGGEPGAGMHGQPPPWPTEKPDACLTLPGDSVRGWAAERLQALGLTFTAEQVDAYLDHARPSFVALFSGSAAGRLMGFRVPALVAGIPVNRDVPADALCAILDEINARHKLGLILQAEQNTRFWSLGSSRAAMLNSLAARERPAALIMDGWLLVASSRSVLDAARVEGANAATGAFFSNDRTSLVVQGTQFAESVKNAVAVYSLSLLVSDPGKRAAVKPVLGVINESMDLLALLGDIHATALQRGDYLVLDLEAVPAQR
jgi:hypothetical protein